HRYCRGEIRRAAVLSSARYSWPHRQNLGVSVCYFLRHRLLWYWEYDPGQCDCLECGKQLDHSPVGYRVDPDGNGPAGASGRYQIYRPCHRWNGPVYGGLLCRRRYLHLLVNLDALPGALASIFTEAFTGTSATGG